MSPAKKTTKKKAKAKRETAKSKSTKKRSTAKTAPKARPKKKPVRKISAKTIAAKRQRAAKPERKTAAKAPAGGPAAGKEAMQRVSPPPPAESPIDSARRPPAPATPRPDAHPKFGVKHTCFVCGAKFYDLFRPEPFCPKCGADQRDAPKPEVKDVSPAKVGRRIKRPMEPLLADDDEELLFDDEETKDLDLGQAGADLDDPAEESEDDIDL